MNRTKTFSVPSPIRYLTPTSKRINFSQISLINNSSFTPPLYQLLHEIDDTIKSYQQISVYLHKQLYNLIEPITKQLINNAITQSQHKSMLEKCAPKTKQFKATKFDQVFVLKNNKVVQKMVERDDASSTPAKSIVNRDYFDSYKKRFVFEVSCDPIQQSHPVLPKHVPFYNERPLSVTTDTKIVQRIRPQTSVSKIKPNTNTSLSPKLHSMCKSRKYLEERRQLKLDDLTH